MPKHLSMFLAAATAVTIVLPGFGDAGFRSKLPQEKRALHALNRLAYGPRPGEVEQVRKTGVDAWVERQLHPERIPESAVLSQRLAPLESLTMETDEMLAKYPPPQLLKMLASGKVRLPDDPERRALLEELSAKYKARLQKNVSKEEAKNSVRDSDAAQLAELLTPQELRTLRRGTPEERVSMLETFPQEKLRDVLFALPQKARRGLMATAPAELRRQMIISAAPRQVLAHDLWEATLYRAVYSERQLEQVLTDFWFNHFNVYIDKGADRYLVTSYERDAVRPHVLGKFSNMLRATASHPAMLWYLDNWQSVSPEAAAARMRPGAPAAKRQRGLNENYARELLELHTLGVDGGYTQKDIVEVARAFTGWTIREPFRSASFAFNPRMHDDGEKVVLGVTIPGGGGQDDGWKVLDIVATHPSTARFLSTKLAQRFVADQPPPSLIDAMSKTFERTGGDLREVMRTLLRSSEFWSEGAYRAKVKSPLEMVASAARATSADVTFAYGLAQRVADLGQPLYRKVEPTGYSNTSEEWVNAGALLARMNFALALAQNQLPGTRVPADRFAGDPAAVAKSLLGADASPQTREAIARGLEEKKDAAVIAGLILGSPEFQRR